MRIISADCHINEPPTVFDRVPAALKDKAPKMLRGEDGGDGWSFDGGPPKRTFGVEAMAGRAKEDYQVSGLKFDEILPGNWDGAEHVKDMDKDGVDVSIVYPANVIFTYVHRNRELAMACMRSYNDWMLEDFQAANPARIVGLPLLPVDDGMDATLAEFDRCQGKGAKGMFIPGLPKKPYNDPYYEPLWQRCEETGIPVTFHRTFGGRPQDQQYDEMVTGKINLAGTVFRFFAGVKPLTYMIYGGVFEKFPNLKMVIGEVNHGWVPFWLQTMDETYECEKAWADLPITRKPSEYCGTNVFVTSLDDYVGYDLIRAGDWPVLEDMVMYSTDYPHSLTLWPNTSDFIPKLMHGLTDQQKDKICSGNAARVYGI